MRYRGALEGNFNKVFLCVLDSLAYSVGNFIGLTHSKAYDSVTVAYDNERAEFHYTSALNCLAYSVDSNDFFGKLQF